MKSIPRLVAGTAVVLAAVLTTAPVTAGIADFVLTQGQQPTKRAAPALTGSASTSVAPVRDRDDDRTRDDEQLGDEERVTGDDERVGGDDRSDDRSRTQGSTTTAADTGSQTTAADTVSHTSDLAASAAQTAGLVAHTAADARSRVSDLADDLQSGVEAGEFSQADADRVLGDLSGYIKGERTWPERTVA
ncbi:hypothetical protein [Brevibacterium marinum]|uniref:Uncharacterized protein n=1 Tax=Brevibacterium marinum TaxID=418643 RepID=A0A846S140_9MICO|nr:hypothetical protein [Brevibacterium marinum]NJC56788.1 hypothetical protein [Brevibacterium marinum]